MSKPNKYSPEVRERAVRRVQEQRGEQGTGSGLAMMHSK